MLYWKALHIVAVISWMAGLLYLFRLFVYHNQETEAVCKERFALMERRLINGIATPAMAAALVSGIMLLAFNLDWMRAGWLQAKLLAVFGLLGVHFWAFAVRRKLLSATRPYRGGFLRWANEIPTILMILIVILVVLKPF